MPPRRKTVDNARGLRQEMSPPEVALWQWMRQRPNGLKFRRQHPVGPYVLDFFCSAAKLAIEIDGSGHDHAQQIAHDERRDHWLREQGIKVLRIKATDVLCDLNNVMLHILNNCRAFPLHHPADGPPPHLTTGRIK